MSARADRTQNAAVARQVDLPARFNDVLEKCAEYLVALCRPDFTWPSINDSGSFDADYSALMRNVARDFSTVMILSGSVQRGQRESSPAERSMYFRMRELQQSDQTGIATQILCYSEPGHRGPRIFIPTHYPLRSPHQGDPDL